MELICEFDAEGGGRVVSSCTAVECATWEFVVQRLREVRAPCNPRASSKKRCVLTASH
jgi:hypothetical protein